MIANPSKARHWRYFLLLEAEFETTMAFIEPVAQNDAVFSLQLAKQLLTICAQFETICRLRVAETNPSSPVDNIGGFYTELVNDNPHLNNAWAKLLTTNESIRPFAGWKVNAPPKWWTDHNKVKHDPSIQLEKGNMANVRFALAGLGVLTHYYAGKGSRIHESRLFEFSI